MDIVRAVARPMLASTFIVGGYGVLRDPASRVETAEKVARPIAGALPVDLPEDTEQLVKINAAVQVGAGTLLALGKFPRLSALALAASLAPTTFAGHRFWELPDGQDKSQQLTHFLKNASLMGGLLIAALDREGRPSLPYRASRAGSRAVDKAEKAAAKAQAGAASGRAAAGMAAAKGGAKATKAVSTGTGKAAKAQTKVVGSAARGVGAVASALPVGR